MVDAATGAPVAGARVVAGRFSPGSPSGRGCVPGLHGEPGDEEVASAETDAGGRATLAATAAPYVAGPCAPGQPCAARSVTPFVRVEKPGFLAIEVHGGAPTEVRLVKEAKVAAGKTETALARAKADRRVASMRRLGPPDARREPANANERDESACLTAAGRWRVLLPAVRVEEDLADARVVPRLVVTVDPASGAVVLETCDEGPCTKQASAVADAGAPPPVEPAPRCLRTRPSHVLACRGTMMPGEPDRVPATACDTCLSDRDCKGPGARCVRVGLVACHGPERFECRSPSPECGGKICPETPALVP